MCGYFRRCLDIMDENTSYNHAIRADFSICYKFNSVCAVTHLHYHNSFEILVPLCEEIKCYINNQTYDVKKGDIFIFPPFVPHKVSVPSNMIYERYIIYFKKKYLTSFSPLTEKLLNDIFYQSMGIAAYIHLGEEQIYNLISLMKKLQKYINSPGYAQEIHIQHTLFEIILLLSKCSYERASSFDVNKNVSYMKIKDILNYIYSNLSEDLSLDNLAANFYINKTSLNKLFKSCTGFSVKHYITTIRIATAQKLLLQNDNVSEIYEQVGFNNYSHFIRTFTKVIGISPKQYSIKNQRL